MASAAQSGPLPASRPRWDEDALAFLIAPVGRDEFFERHYEREPLLSPGGDPARHAELLTLAALDHFLASADLREGMVDLANRRERLSRDDYVDERGGISRIALAEHYHRGATIILPHLHESVPELGEFARSLEEIFSCHVQTNVYLTPSGNQGFPIHYDNHDVFVLQISGAKAWRLYDRPLDIPYRGEGFELGAHEPGPLSAEFTLRPGDCVYVPRGLMHDAENVGDEPSLHITVGLIVKTWADLLLEAVSELALEEPEFRRALPPGFALRDFDREQARKRFDSLVATIAAKASMDGAFDLMADNFLRGRRPNLEGVIMAHPPAPRPGARYRRRRFVPWNVADDEGRLVLVGPGGDVHFAPEQGEALERALSGAPFTLDELHGPDIEALVRKLWTAGYIEPADPPA